MTTDAASVGAPAQAATRRRWLRDCRIAVKLGLIAGIGFVVTMSVTGLGIHGLSTVYSRTSDLSSISGTLKNVAELRDAEGDMRVNANTLAAAFDAKSTQSTQSESRTTDARVDQVVALLAKSSLSAHDTTAGRDLAEFSSGLAQWRTLRDQKLAPAALAGNRSAAQAILNGPMDKADNDFGGSLDDFVSRLNAQVQPAIHDANRAYSTSSMVMILALVLGTAVAGALTLLIARLILLPVRRVSTVLSQLSAGDLTGSADVKSSDEIGRMAASLDTAIKTLRSTVTALATNAGSLAIAAGELSATNTQILASADHTAATAAVVSGAAGDISTSVSSVASGSEEMGASIREIALNVNEAAQVAAAAVQSTEAASATIAELSQSSAEINTVVKTITSIAEQTNLLALNATIEAARAGEAGKGFAVVATEVKDLAQETARATETISKKVEAIQADTASAVAAITEVGNVIARINDTTSMIAAAVEEQTVTTNEMARSVSTAAQSSGRIAESISEVAQAAETTTAGVTASSQATEDLARMAAELDTVVKQFRY